VKTLINGAPCDTISVNDRGLLYGDGVFRTLRLCEGKILQWQRHYARLLKDCNSIRLPCPSESLLLGELKCLIQGNADGILKIIVTRGAAQRGYTPPHQADATRILSLSPTPVFPQTFSKAGVRMHLCQLRLGHQPRLAGVKHLNRLENVLAAAEWDDPDIGEGLLLDESGYVIEGVRSNIFMVKQGDLITPHLSRCGVSGVQRERIGEWATQQGMAYKSIDVTLQDLLDADEVFLANSVIGVWPVREISGCQWHHHPVAKTIQDWLAHDSH
jgi:4-amino-4-deoxychorismate lyase